MLGSVELFTRQFRSRTAAQRARTAVDIAVVSQMYHVREDVRASGCLSSLIVQLRRAGKTEDRVRAAIGLALVNLGKLYV